MEKQKEMLSILLTQNWSRLWWTSDTGSNTDNANMKHSIVSRISTLDRDADGLVDHLYFGDLGGQIFRVDLNNNQTKPIRPIAVLVSSCAFSEFSNK
jgi:Tfp pilus tip-associated adhesin PilY1